MFTLVFIFCIRFLIRFSSRSHRLTIWDMMGAASAATPLLLILFVCVCVCLCICVAFGCGFDFDFCSAAIAGRGNGCASKRRVGRCCCALFLGAFANECDLDLSSWFIILRCLRSCCCRCRCCCVCAFVLLSSQCLDWCCCCCRCCCCGSGTTAVIRIWIK